MNTWHKAFRNRLLKNVASEGQARRNQPKKRSLLVVNEHFEADFNAAWPSAVVLQRPVHTRTGARQRGFTLLEILVVLVILGLMASLVGPQVFKQLSGSKTKAAALQIQELSAALDLYRLELGSFPSSDQGLEALIIKPRNVEGWNGPYLKKNVIRKDPWGHDFQYRAPGQNGDFDLWSLGADNREGGEGEDRDVRSWE